MKRWIASGLLSLTLLLPLAKAQAFYDEYNDIYTYAGGGLHIWNDGGDSALGFKLRFGQHLNTFVGAEVQLGHGGTNDNDVGLDWLFGGYARFALPLGHFTPFAKLGLTAASLQVADTSTTDFGLGYGLGVEFDLPRAFYLDIEYMSYMAADADNVETDLDALTLGVGYKF
ncbi:Opacity protein [Marinospirillum celere]|uniref:Opacity protein n=1 Tax=Marinospirillum celere TaxID=1122252 RepID=A0A1I1GU53_9GAMM|nr:porin family protein [Marinospirillum celere]SFC15194.1 Opacity protein [Marinospirillum celere]